ncbi:MAG: hypothetical protein RLZZ488_2513 [Pseudomonadota bacterium]
MLFACIVLKFSLTQTSATRLHLNLLTIINIIGLSPLVLLLLTKFPLNNDRERRLEILTPAFVNIIAIFIQLKVLAGLLGDGKLSSFGFSANAALIPVLILGESTSVVCSTLRERAFPQHAGLAIIFAFALILIFLAISENNIFGTEVIYRLALILNFIAATFGLVIFYLNKYARDNGKMLSILLYYCIQSGIMCFFISTFDAQINNAILALGVVFALTLDSVFLRPDSLNQNGFSLSLANRRLRDAYEKQASDSATLAQATLDSLSAQICIVDSTGIVTEVNRAWRLSAIGIVSADKDTIVGQNYLMPASGVNDEDSPFSAAIRNGIRDVLDGRNEEFSQTYFLKIDNTKRWYQCKVTRFETSRGRCAVVVHEDVTELKMAEEQLLLKSAAIERANDGIVLTDPALPDQPVVYASPGFLKLTGYTQEEVLGRNCRFLQGPDTDPATIRELGKAIRAQIPYSCDILNYTKSGQAWINRLKLEPILDENGKLLRYLGVQSNVTEQRRLERERNQALEKERLARLEMEKHYRDAQSANNLKDEFLATLSHELRTPAGVIGGFVELLKYERLNETERDEAIDAIERNSRSLVTLIDDILDVSRVITGKFKLNPKPVDLANIVESVISAELLAAQSKNIRIVTEFEPNLGPVYGDVTRLQQIFWNLLSNAIKFTPRNGRVKVTLKMDGARALVRISDTGVGINPQFLPHVFERFRQQDSGMNRMYGGLGLGLSIVKHLVELHGGSVWAESAGEGRGSAFTVSLPVLTSSG